VKFKSNIYQILKLLPQCFKAMSPYYDTQNLFADISLSANSERIKGTAFHTQNSCKFSM